MTKLNHERGRRRGQPIERLRTDTSPPAGSWTHIKREPVKRLTAEERAALIAERPDLQ